MAKMAQNLQEKIQNNRLPVGFRTSYRGDFFVGIGVLHVFTEFRTCMWNVARGALYWNFIGGAIGPRTSETLIRCKSGVCKISGVFEHV